MTSTARKQRLDSMVVGAGWASNREQAARLILAGRVRVDGQVVDKPGKQIVSRAAIEVEQPEWKYVSRGGEKLAAALEAFSLSCTDKVVMDVGASTGGFTDCVLQRGSKRVYAIDVGYGQLAWPLRNDPRVIVMDRKNIRNLRPQDLPECPEWAVVDVSFISLRLVLPALLPVLQEEATLVVLFKPQFEVGKEQVGKGGIVRDQALRQVALTEFLAFTRGLGLGLIGILDSPILGKKGNQEVLVGLKKGQCLPGGGKRGLIQV